MSRGLSAATVRSNMADDVSGVQFIDPIAGFPDDFTYGLDPIDDAGVFFSLRSRANPALRFILSPPVVFFTEYAPSVDESFGAALGSTGPDDLLLFVIVTVSRSLADATANLRAPIVLCLSTRRAVQVVLDDDRLSFREAIAR